MVDEKIVTPFFLDQALPDLEPLSGQALANAPPLPSGDIQERMSALHRNLADRVERAVRAGRRPVSIAGDCCATIGVLAGLQRAGVAPALIWLDAHGDFNTWETTPSGFLGGMPLAMLVGRGELRMVHAVNLKPLAEDHIILSDGRDLDPGEARALAGSGIRHLRDLGSLRPDVLPDRPLYVHFDVDLLRPDVLPAVSYPAPGGPGPKELARIFEMLAGSGRVTSISLSTWNPALDPDGRSMKICLDLLEILTDAPI